MCHNWRVCRRDSEGQTWRVTLFLPDRMSASDRRRSPRSCRPNRRFMIQILGPVAKPLLSCRAGFALGTEIADAFLFGSSTLPLRTTTTTTTKLSIMERLLRLQCIGLIAVIRVCDVGALPHMTPRFDLRVSHKDVQQQVVDTLRARTWWHHQSWRTIWSGEFVQIA
jgi:hypothetical protein